MSHALLSPSGAEKWLTCTPSARLELQFPDKSSSYADEGTCAHKLGELLVRKLLKMVTPKQFNMEFKAITSSIYYDEDMAGYAEGYALYVVERFNSAKAHTPDAQIFLEIKLDISAYIPNSYGTGDTVIVANTVMDVIDMKYGKGVRVDVRNNRQAMLYALGALGISDYLFDITEVRMTIYQPRMDNISTWSLSVVELQKWADTELKPRAIMAFEGKGDYIAGEHCKFCKAKPLCRAYRDMNMQIAKLDFSEPVLLSDDEIAEVLDQASGFREWLNAVDEYALEQAVSHNKKWPGYKLVAGRSVRKYSDENEVGEKLIEAGYKADDLYTKNILGITAMEKLIGKSAFQIHLNELIVKPPGKPTLTVESDKRPELNSNDAAKKDFESA
jgi:hypothetical protein